MWRGAARSPIGGFEQRSWTIAQTVRKKKTGRLGRRPVGDRAAGGRGVRAREFCMRVLALGADRVSLSALSTGAESAPARVGSSVARCLLSGIAGCVIGSLDAVAGQLANLLGGLLRNAQGLLAGFIGGFRAGAREIQALRPQRSDVFHLARSEG